MKPAFLRCESHPGRPLIDHLLDVANRLTVHGPLVRLAGLCHDFGKATAFFQDYLKNIPITDLRLKHHSHLGAVWLFHQLLPKVVPNGLSIQDATMAYLMVACHHTGLKNVLDSLPPSDSGETIRQKQLEVFDMDGATSWYESVLREPVTKPTVQLNWSKCRRDLEKVFRGVPSAAEKMASFQVVLQSFGLLIEADRDSATGYSQDQFQAPLRFTMERIDRFRASSSFGAADPRVVLARDEVYRSAVSGASERTADAGHLWSLTVPTGSGKTLAAVGWALRRRELRMAAGRSACPIIYALPFTSIIDQNASVLGRVWGSEEPDESTLAIHHHVAEPGELARSGEQSLARSWVEAWRSDLVCTTFVQVINALFHGTVADARRFSRLAGSILILDEVQAIPAKYWRIVNLALQCLSSHWGTDILLVTATQPAIFPKSGTKELCPSLAEPVSSAFDRYDLELKTEKEITLEELAQQVRLVVDDVAKLSCLVILNTVQEALDLHALMSARTDPVCVPIFHLSTNLRPKDRKRILRQISERVGTPCLLIATQVVEAGVDLSFDVVFRALAPLDAVVQAAGRCNRHGMHRRGKVVLMRIEGNMGHVVYGDKEIATAREVLEQAASQSPVISEPRLRACVEDYFRLVANRTGSSISDKIIEAVQYWEFSVIRGQAIDDKKDRDKVVRLIDERNDTIPHFIMTDASDLEVWDRFRDALLRFDQPCLRELRPLVGQRIVGVPRRFALSAEIEDLGLVEVTSSIAERRYNLNTGWIRECLNT